MHIVRGITAILAGLTLLALSGTPSQTAEASLRQHSITVLYSGEQQSQPDFNVEDWYPGTKGTETVDIINDGSETTARVTAGNMSKTSIAYDTDVTLSLASGDVLYQGKYSDMDVDVFIPQDSTLKLTADVQWNPSPTRSKDVIMEALAFHVAVI